MRARTDDCTNLNISSGLPVLLTHLGRDLLESALEISSLSLVSHPRTFALMNISDGKMSMSDCTPRGNTFWNLMQMNGQDKKIILFRKPSTELRRNPIYSSQRGPFRIKASPPLLTNCMMYVHDARKATIWLSLSGSNCPHTLQRLDYFAGVAKVAAGC